MHRAEPDLHAALIAHGAGDTETAAKLYQDVLAARPETLTAIVNLAALCAAGGDYPAAETLYRQALDVAPGDAQVLCNFANMLQTTGRLEAAERSYLTAISLDPGLALAQTNLGILYAKQARFDAAERHFAAALAADPACVPTYAGLAGLRQSQGDIQAAIELLRQGLEIDPDDASTGYNLALLEFDAGNGAEAEAIIRDLLRRTPEAPDLHYQLGRILLRGGRAEAAITALRQALDHQPGHVGALQDQSAALLELGRLDEALEVLDRCGHPDEDCAITCYQRAQIFAKKGDSAAALAHFETAYRLAPEIPETLYGLATACQECGQIDRALTLIDGFITAHPDYTEAYITRGNCLSALNRPEQAIPDYEKAIAQRPDLVFAFYNLGHAHRQMGDLDAARRSFETALSIEPGLLGAINGLGVLAQQSGDHNAALDFFERALALEPEFGDALNNKAISLQQLGRFGEAVEAFQAFIQNDPSRGAVYFNLGGLLQALERWDESIVVLKQGQAQDPGCWDIYPYLLHALMQQCDWTNLEALIQKVGEITENQLASPGRVSFTPFALQSLPGDIPMALRQRVAERICERIENSVPRSSRIARPSHRQRQNGEQLTIGYVSPDFRAHSVAVAFRGIIDNHDRDRFRFHGYSLHPGEPDAMSHYFREKFDRFVDLAPLSHVEAAERINADGVDILIDLAGHTRGTRLEIFALRPAAIQAHYLGYSATVGASFIDYLITDHHQIPEAQNRFFTEQLVYLPDTFMAARPAEVATHGPSRSDYGLPDDGFVFANFNKHYKHEPKMFGLAMRLLKKRPGSVYWLRQGTAKSIENLRHEAAVRGIDPERLIFANQEPHARHLARLALADLALDNLYHGGGVTTVDALWVGLPVLSLAGETPQSRNGASLLQPIGLPDMIVETLAAFEATALDLATDPDRLAGLRRTLLANRQTHALFDIARLTGHLERAFELMWQNYAAGHPPRPIDVAPTD